MRRSEEGMLMLTCTLGQDVMPLAPAEYQYLAKMSGNCVTSMPSGEVSVEFLCQLGCSVRQAERIVSLLDREEALRRYLMLPNLSVVTRISEKFPERMRILGSHCPSVLFCKGDVSLLQTRCIALVGARDLPERNRRFAEHIGRLAAQEGFTLVSGGAVGADIAAQNACLAAGGRVICFVPDALKRYKLRENVLYCSDEGWEFAFSAARALRRNRYIHALGEKVFVARCNIPKGGTWSGTSYNLQHRLSEVYILEDDAEGTKVLSSMGAVTVSEDVPSIRDLLPTQLSIFD